MSRPSRAGNEFAGFLPQASASGSLPPPFPSLRSACCQGACDHCFTYGGSCCCRKSAAFQRHELGCGSRCPPPTRARSYPPGISIRTANARWLYFWTLVKALRSTAYNDFSRHVFSLTWFSLMF